MAYSESLAQQVRAILATDLPPHVFEEEVEEKNHHLEKEGVEMIVMNEDPHGKVRIRKERTSHQGATQNEDIKLMLVNGYPAPTPTITREKLSLRLRIYSR